MANAILLHGAGESPDRFWFPSVAKYLMSGGYDVWAPQLPDAQSPRLSSWLPFVKAAAQLDHTTILIGHSAGCPLALSLLQGCGIVIEQTICVAGFYQPIDSTADQILQDTYDWEIIKKNSREFVFINSDNDPWNCHDRQARASASALGAWLITAFGQGHMGSGQFNQPYLKFPLLERAISRRYFSPEAEAARLQH